MDVILWLRPIPGQMKREMGVPLQPGDRGEISGRFVRIVEYVEYAAHPHSASDCGRHAGLGRAARSRAPWHGGLARNSRHPGGPEDSRIGRERHRRRGCGGICARRDALQRRQYRRRRIHAGAAGRWTNHLHRFPRARARIGVARHVSRCHRQADARQHHRVPRVGRSRHRRGSGIRVEAFRQAAVGGTGAAGHRPRRQGLSALLRAGQRIARRRVGRLSRIEAHLPARWKILRARRRLRAARSREDAHAHRAIGQRRISITAKPPTCWPRI